MNFELWLELTLIWSKSTGIRIEGAESCGCGGFGGRNERHFWTAMVCNDSSETVKTMTANGALVSGRKRPRRRGDIVDILRWFHLLAAGRPSTSIKRIFDFFFRDSRHLWDSLKRRSRPFEPIFQDFSGFSRRSSTSILC